MGPNAVLFGDAAIGGTFNPGSKRTKFKTATMLEQPMHELCTPLIEFFVSSSSARPDGVNPLVAAVVARARREPTMRRPS